MSKYIVETGSHASQRRRKSQSHVRQRGRALKGPCEGGLELEATWEFMGLQVSVCVCARVSAHTDIRVPALSAGQHLQHAKPASSIPAPGNGLRPLRRTSWLRGGGSMRTGEHLTVSQSKGLTVQGRPGGSHQPDLRSRGTKQDHDDDGTTAGQ